MQVTSIEAAAIEKFVLQVTVPLLYDRDDLALLRATGTLFKIANRAFIVTARHVFDDLSDLTKLAFPEHPISGGLFTLGSFEVLRPVEDHIDVAAIELKSPATIDKLTRNWQFLSLSNIASPSAKAPDGSFFVSGYPASLTVTNKSWTRGKLVTAYTQRISTVPVEAEQPVVPGLDFFFDYGREATLVSGGSVSTPELPGVSGASIWELRATSDVWAPENVTRVVGIQSAYLHSKYIRAKSWLAVAKVLEQAGEPLAGEIRDKINKI